MIGIDLVIAINVSTFHHCTHYRLNVQLTEEITMRLRPNEETKEYRCKPPATRHI